VDFLNNQTAVFSADNAGFMPSDSPRPYPSQLSSVPSKPLTTRGRNRQWEQQHPDSRHPVDPLHHPEIADFHRLRQGIAEECALDGVLVVDDEPDDMLGFGWL
jgi:hypothetical protein